ncbi:MAG: aspartate aminotransferase family protein [Coriobacteriaceae bacterium]|nr:aspartate aminotransferase family protein [Coriobacteriaceae bacterium]
MATSHQTADAQLQQARELDARYLMQTFGTRKPVEFVRGRGTRLYDSAGTEYIDFLAGIGVVSVGHCHPRLVEAVQEQAGKLFHVGNYFFSEHRGEVAERLVTLLSAGNGDVWKLFFCNSGAEANEGAIKLARRWGRIHRDGAAGIITATQSFHGRTLATLAATGQEALQEPFEPLPAGFAQVPLNDIAALEAACEHPVDGSAPVAVMLECIQGEAGVWPCTEEYLQAARELTAAHDMLLILDEVQTGMYRCGEPFAYQTYGVVPDIVTMAKGIAGGFPMGAFAARDELADVLEAGMHGSTFGGGPLACAAAEATLSVMDAPGFGAHITETGEYLRSCLGELPFVTDVRGRGLMVGISLERPCATELVDTALAAGFVLNAPADDIVRFLPPLIMERDDIDILMQALPELYAKS